MSTTVAGSCEGIEELKALSMIIQDSIAFIEATTQAKNVEFPSMHTQLTLESEGPRMLPDIDRACSTIVAAATQLEFSARSPMLSVITISMQHSLSAALRVAVDTNIAEACREAGPQGAHVKELARASTIDPTKLARVLRVLATHHIFVEVTPDVFANNRVSAALDTGNSVKDILANPRTKHIGSSGIAAAVAHCSDEAMKSAAFMSEVLLDSKLGASQQPNETPFNVAFKTELPIWEWFETAENEFRRIRFGMAMEGAKQASDPNSILEGFDWKGLRENAVVVDVGGGIGSQSMTLAQNHPHLRFVIQDRESVVKDAGVFWDGGLPGSIKSGRVILQAHDFFKPQPVKDADVFLLRNIIHDWSDKYCIQILRRLREAATPSTRLMIVDNLMPYACVDEHLKTIPGAEYPLPPVPLLPNLGHASAIAYFEDMQMIELLNGTERTITQVQHLLQETGWKLVQIVQGANFSTQKAIAVPA